LSERSKAVLLAFLNLLGFIGTVAVNALANILPINNKATGELSDSYPNLFVPTALTFAIWGLIYALLFVFIVYQFVVAFRKNTWEKGVVRKAGIFFIISSVLNMGWIFAWHYEQVLLSLIIMILLFISLLIIYLRLRIGRSDASKSEKICSHIPFSVYIGWITIATIANVTAFLVNINWNRFGLSDQIWTLLVIAVGILISLGMLFIRKDIFYNLVVVWSFTGILLKRISDKGADDLYIVIISIAGIAALMLGIIFQIIRRKKLY